MWGRIQLTWEVRIATMSCPDCATSQPLPCVLSFKGEASVGQAIPLRGMFTAILQVTKLVWRQNNVEDPCPSISDLHLCLHLWLPYKRKGHRQRVQ